MPGMMDTILNLGMNDATVAIVAAKAGNPKFAWDSYRRFLQMYGDVVLGVQRRPEEDHEPFESTIERLKDERYGNHHFGYAADTDDMKELVSRSKRSFASGPARTFRRTRRLSFGARSALFLDPGTTIEPLFIAENTGSRMSGAPR